MSTSDTIFGIEPVSQIYAINVEKMDLILVSDGKAMPTLELVQDVTNDLEDENFILIKLHSQRTLRLYRGIEVQIARKGTNQNFS